MKQSIATIAALALMSGGMGYGSIDRTASIRSKTTKKPSAMNQRKRRKYARQSPYSKYSS